MDNLIGRRIFLTLALLLIQLFLIYLKILKNLAFGRNHWKLRSRPKRDKSASETEPGLFMESCSSPPPTHTLVASQTAVARVNLAAAELDSSTLQDCCFYTLLVAHLSAQGLMFCGGHLLMRVIIALVEASMPSKVEKQL